jgi:hypothetical protein
VANEKNENQPEFQIISADINEEVYNRNELPSECWLHSPGQVELMSVADKRLARVNEQRGGSNTRPAKVSVVLVMPERCLYIQPLSKTGDGYTVNHINSSTWINIRPLLHKTNQLIEKGEKWRFGVEMVGKESPVGEALKITLGEIREKARDVKKKSKAKPKSPTAIEAKKEEPAADVTGEDI